MTSLIPGAAALAFAVALPLGGHAQEAGADSVSPLDSLRTLELSVVEALPELKDRRQAARLIVRHYPRALRDAGRGGTVGVRIRVDPQGVPQRSHVMESSGVVELDRAALQVAAELRFSPARADGRPVAAWVYLPIEFRAPLPRVVPLDSIGIP